MLLFIPALVSRLYNIPVILEVNGRLIDESMEIDHSFIGKFLFYSRIFEKIESYNVNSAKGIVVIATGIKEQLIENYNIDPNKIAVIPNGVDIDLFKPRSKTLVRKKLGLIEKSTYVGYIGSLHSWQGLNFILESAKDIISKRENVNFLIIGKGSEADKISSFIKKNNLSGSIELRRAVSHETVPDYVNALDICLSYPTNFRNGSTSPFKIYEYLSCGRPVISSDIKGMREEFGEVLIYAKSESKESLSKTIISLIDNSKKRKKLGVSARKFVEEGHSWRIVAQRIIEFCKK